MVALLGRIAPMLFLAALLGGFMALDKLWLHWYAPDTLSPPVERRLVVNGIDASASPTASSSPSAAAQPTPSTEALRVKDAFAALWVASQASTYRARYETSSAAGAPGDVYLVFSQPPMARVDTIPAGTLDANLQIITTGDGTVIECRRNAVAPTCESRSPQDAALPSKAGPISFPSPAEFASLSVIETAGRSIAGADSRCFHLQNERGELDSEVDYCFSRGDAPVPVYARGAFGTVSATDLASDVPPDAFASPGTMADPTGLVRFVDVIGASAGGTASASVQTLPGAPCSIEYSTPAGGQSAAQGLVDKTADQSGLVIWSWKIGPQSRLGAGTVTVTCNGDRASADVPIG